MSTTPSTPAPTVTTNALTRDWDWLKAHLVGLTLLFALSAGAVYGIETLVAKHDLAAEERADAKLATFVNQSTQAQQQLAATQQSLLTMIQQLQAQNAQLAQSVVARNSQVKKVVQNDATLSAQQAAVRLATQTSAQPGEISATGNEVTMDLPITRSIVASLDLLPAVQENLQDTNAQLANETQLFNQSQAANAQSAKVISDLQAQNKEQVAACATEVKALNAKHRKQLFKVGVVSYAAGFVSGLIVHIL